jgi:hypothetical protein
MILHIAYNLDSLPDLEIRDELDNLVAVIFNQTGSLPAYCSTCGATR